MANKNGVLKCSNRKIEVNFHKLMWFQSHGQQQQIRSFWQQRGFMEPVELPYEQISDGLIVKRNIEAYGWAVADNIDRQIHELPF